MGIEYLKQRKKELHMTSEDLALKSGVPLSTLNKILSGQTADPKFETLKAICMALSVSLADLDDFESKNWYPSLTNRDHTDIAKSVEAMVSGLDSNSSLMFDGEEIDDTTRELLKRLLTNTMEMARLTAKEKFTPKKYRK